MGKEGGREGGRKEGQVFQNGCSRLLNITHRDAKKEGGREGGRARKQQVLGERMSVSELELDADVRDVINRGLVKRDR